MTKAYLNASSQILPGQIEKYLRSLVIMTVLKPPFKSSFQSNMQEVMP